eukprot:4811826-Alexandrium_andersonii.AAC.1
MITLRQLRSHLGAARVAAAGIVRWGCRKQLTHRPRLTGLGNARAAQCDLCPIIGECNWRGMLGVRPI